MGPGDVAPLVAGGASLLGGLLQQGTSAKMAREAMRFSERMSSTQHQREVVDLRRAGLNPMLSINGGASSPSGVMGQAQDAVGAGVASAQEARRLSAELKNVNEDTTKKRAEGDLARQHWQESSARTENVAAQTDLLKYQMPGASARAAFDRTTRGKNSQHIGRFIRLLTGQQTN